MARGGDGGVKSADRTMDVLEFIARAKSAPSFAELSRGLDIPKSSLFHLLSSLARRDYIEQVQIRGGYRLGPAVLELAQRMCGADGVMAQVRPLVRELSTVLNETCGYYEMRGDHAELVVASSAWHPLRIDIPLGRTMPLHAASNGRVLLAELSDQEIEAYIARTTFEAFTSNTITEADALRREIAAIRRTGVAESNGEFAVGIMSIAKALRQNEELAGSIGVILPTARYSPAFGDEARRQLAAIADRFERLGEDLRPAFTG